MKNVLTSLLALSFTLSACTSPVQDSLNGTASDVGIYDGEITPAENPITRTTVFLYADDGLAKNQCTGSVLSSTVILTAAHCVTDDDEATQTVLPYRPDQISVLDPQRVLFEGANAVITKASKVLVHPFYARHKMGLTRSNFHVGYDLALIQLSQPLPATFKPVILSDKLDELTKNQVFAAGFGLYDIVDVNPMIYALRHGPVTVDLSEHQIHVPPPGSESPRPYFTTNTTSSAIIAYKKTSTDASICHGDSGGPLYYVKDGEIYLAGVNVAIIDYKDKSNCALERDIHEASVSMSGPQLTFVLNSFKELTGKSLPLVRDVPEMDPNTFEFYLHTPVLSSKNNIANLEGYAAAIDTRDNTLIILDQLTAATICEKMNETITEMPGLYILFDQVSLSNYDGKTVLPIMMSHHGVIDGVVEGRAKLEGEKLKLVVLTAEGYLSAELPVKTCH